MELPRGRFTYQPLKAIGKQLNTNYKVNLRYIANPFDHIYQNHDVEVSNRPEIQELQDLALDLSDKIEGDFDLEFLTFEIRNNQLAFARTGLIAAQIKFKKLYKKTHRNFDHYCREKLGVSYWQIDDTIKATDVVMELLANGFDVLPQNVNQGEKLAHIRGSERVRIWREIVETYQPHEITGRTIEEYIAQQEEKVLPQPTQTYTVEMSDELYCFLWALGHFIFGIQGVTEFLSALLETSKKLGNSLSLEGVHQNLERLYQEHNSEVNRK
ncbi:MAG: hypothetical protein QNJ38_14395 [Prochloraceae cyanobacterium]|nr:hypothetical protein [Prochloraceae cyanobacterium]